ncbi:MAG: hypothetical protein AAGJ73_12890 [Pseudomonadota bacterium]
MSDRVKIEQHSDLGLFWFIGWLFSIGYLKLSFWKGVLALLVWPYFLGAEFAPAPDAQPTQEAEAVQSAL